MSGVGTSLAARAAPVGLWRPLPPAGVELLCADLQRFAKDPVRRVEAAPRPVHSFDESRKKFRVFASDHVEPALSLDQIGLRQRIQLRRKELAQLGIEAEERMQPNRIAPTAEHGAPRPTTVWVPRTQVIDGPLETLNPVPIPAFQ